jgi:hypothetical protein
MGYSPEIWGRQAWHFIHMVALSYPEKPSVEDRKNFMRFFNSLPYTLPCPICGEHFKENMKTVPPRMGSRKELFEWTVDMHNEVNKRNKKKILSYNQAIDELQKNSKKNLASWSDRDLAKALLTSAFLSSLLVFFSYTIAKKR